MRDGGEHGVILLHDMARDVGSDREFFAALADGEAPELCDGVVGNADHRGAQGLELRHRLGEIVRFDGASRREGGGIEVEHHRTFLQRIGQGKGVGVAPSSPGPASSFASGVPAAPIGSSVVSRPERLNASRAHRCHRSLRPELADQACRSGCARGIDTIGKRSRAPL